MTANAESKSSTIDIIKLLVALALLIASITGFYLFSEASLLYRVLGLLAVAGAGVALALTTEKGKGLLTFMGAARTEVRKVVWPSRQETMQTTLMVFIIVVILSIFLWFVDMFLGWGVKALLATGS
ncbi:MAG: preprotein translocase subunit SecE [Proteobacteria bacterium]|nr:MAG: preprotein translocase subunit SecE [Pseudomonadota bacterium]